MSSGEILKQNYHKKIFLIAMFPQVIDVIKKIDPGFSIELGSILYQLAETTKYLAKKQYLEKQITEEDLQIMILHALTYFNDYQKCVILSFKKD